jgi:lysophospholipase L1-like esterase
VTFDMKTKIYRLSICIIMMVASLEILLRYFHALPDPYIKIKYEMDVASLTHVESWQDFPGHCFSVGSSNHNFDGNLDRSVVVINAQGFRGDVITKNDVNPEVVRILSLGGSTTACESQSEDLTWPALVKNILKNDSGKEVKILNASQRGQTIKRNLLPLVQLAPQLKPHYITCLVGINDALLHLKNDGNWEESLPNIQTLGQKNYFKLSCKIFLSEFQIFRSLRYLHNMRQINNMVSSNLQYDAFLNREYEKEPLIDVSRYRNLVKIFCSTTRAMGAKPVLITQPSIYFSKLPDEIVEAKSILSRSNGKRWHRYVLRNVLDAYNKTLIDVGTQEKAIIIDAASKFNNDLSEMVDDCHFTDEGCQKMALLVSNAIEQDAGASLLKSKHF